VITGAIIVTVKQAMFDKSQQDLVVSTATEAVGE
jgi:hypothetical protein